LFQRAVAFPPALPAPSLWAGEGFFKKRETRSVKQLPPLGWFFALPSGRSNQRVFNGRAFSPSLWVFNGLFQEALPAKRETRSVKQLPSPLGCEARGGFSKDSKGGAFNEEIRGERQGK
jgi:hypothetical protein